MSRQAVLICLRGIFSFILAQTAKAMDLEPTIYFLGEGISVVKRRSRKNKMVAFPSLKDVMDKTTQMSIPYLFVSKAQVFGENLP